MELQNQLQKKYEAIEAEISRLEGLHSEQYKTSGSFRYNPTNIYSVIDVTSTTNQAELIHAFAFIKNKEAQYIEAAGDIGLTEFPLFKWCGYTPEDWFHDIKLRFKFLKSEGQLQKLKEAKNKIQPYLPKDHIIQQLLLELPF